MATTMGELDGERTPNYRCQSCEKRISPDLDDIGKGWGKCPHCHHRHPQAVKMRAGAFALFGIITIVLCFTIVGMVLAPFTGVVAYYYYRQTLKMLEKDEYRIGTYGDQARDGGTDGEPDSNRTSFWFPEGKANAPWYKKSVGQLYREWRGSDDETDD